MMRHHARCHCHFEIASEEHVGAYGQLHEAAAEHAMDGSQRPFTFQSSTRHYERDRPFRVTKLELDWTLRVATASVAGSATLHVERIDMSATELELDAIAFEIASVKVDGRKVHAPYDGAVLRVPIGLSVTRASVVISYSATPRRGMYFLAPDSYVPSRPHQVWTQCQEEDARHFIPCHDKPHVKMATSLRVVVPKGWQALSNGKLVTQDTVGGNPRFAWEMAEPHASYLITLAAGEFEEIRAKAGKVPLTYLVPKGRKEDGLYTFQHTPKMIELFGTLLGAPYPWNKYAQVVVSDFIFGGMENTTATTLYEHVLLDPRARLDITSDDLIAHELAHQWFGDYLTCRDWSEGWLNEGFATYFEHLWREETEGQDAYDYGLLTDLESYLGETRARYRRPVVCQDYDAPLDLFDRHLYEKGGLFLHTLRQKLGSAAFFAGLKHYVAKHANGVVETRDLLRALEETSGRSLGQMFDEGLYKAGHVELSVDVKWAAGVLSITCRQGQREGMGVPSTFHVPIVLELGYLASKEKRTPERTVRHEMELDKRTETFALPCPERPDFVVVDPTMQILGAVDVRAPNDMLRIQLTSAKSARGRWLAAQALRASDDEPTAKSLETVLGNSEEFWGVRVETATTLGHLRTKSAERILLANIETSHPKVRRAVASALGAFQTDKAAEALATRALIDESYIVCADAARALGRSKQTLAFDALVTMLSRSSWGDVIQAGALDGLAALKDERGLAHAEAHTKYGIPTRARRAAILAVAKLASEKRAQEVLEELLDDNDPHLRIDVVRALVLSVGMKARGALGRRLERDLDPRVRRRIREALRELSTLDSKKEVANLREEMDRMQRDYGSLKAKLTELEATMTNKTAVVSSRAKPAKKSARAGKAN